MAGTSRSGGDRTVNTDLFPAVSLGGPPQAMSDAQKEIWADIVQSTPPGLLHALDTYQLQILCECIDTKNKLQAMIEISGGKDAKAIVGYHKYTSQINRLSAQFGLSPGDRRRIKVEPVEETDDAEEWLGSE